MIRYQLLQYTPTPLPNYGALTDISKALNELFGDGSGRTISARTATGFQNLFNAHHLTHPEAEFVVHAGMVTAGSLLRSKEEGNQAAGIVLATALLLCYQAGK